jgi:Tol biopolymer transport system component
MSRLKLLTILAIAAALGLAGCSREENAEDSRGFSVPQSPLLAALERKVGLIAYVGADGNLYTISQGGGTPSPITTDAKLEQDDFNFYEFPTWSPDGKSLAFYGLKGTGQLDIVASIYTSDSEGKSVVEAHTSDRHVPVYLSWSPDSSRVAFISSITGGSGLVFNMVPAVGGDTQVLDVGSPYYWDWLPDSSGVIVHTGGPSRLDSEARLAVLTLNDGVIEDTLALKPALFQSPALSPDGSKMLVAIEDDEGKNSLVVTDRLGGVQTVLATYEDAIAFAWSPDGKRVAYISGDSGTGLMAGKLTFVELGEKPVIVEADKEGIAAFYWAPDSGQVVFFVPETVTVDAESGGESSTGLFLKMYVTGARSGTSKLLASFVPTQQWFSTFPYFDQYSRSTTIWSPDSQYLVVSAYAPDGTPGIYLVPASGVTDPRFLIEGTVGFWSAK